MAGVPSLNKPLRDLFAASTREILVSPPIKKGTLVVTVNEKGNLESAKNEDVLCEVEGSTTIIMIKPEGTKVKKGDVVCELDSATLRDNLNNQQITTQQAEASYQQAAADPRGRRDRRQGVRRGHLQAEPGDDRGRDRPGQGRAQAGRGPLRVDRARWSRRSTSRVAQQTSPTSSTSRRPSSRWSRPRPSSTCSRSTRKEKTIKELEAEVEKARPTSWPSRRPIAGEDQGGEARPPDRALHPQGPRRRPDRLRQRPRAGSAATARCRSRKAPTVRERQKIFSLPDITKMRVNTKVHESMVDRVEPGPAGPDPGRRLRRPASSTASVQSVHPLPDAEQLVRLRHQGLHDPGRDRERPAGPPARACRRRSRSWSSRSSTTS